MQGIAGAELLGLQRPAQPPVVEQFAHPLTAMSIHYVDRGRRQLCRQAQYVREHRHAGQRLQHLRDVRLHALALAGGQDDDR